MTTSAWDVERLRTAEKLGVGRFCEIHKVVYYGPANFERAFALKRPLWSEKERPDVALSLESEAGYLGLLHCPHVVSPLDIVRDRDRPMLLMNYVPGTDLRRVVDRHGALAPEILWPLAAQIAVALQAIHALGIVHRDVVLQNLLINRDGWVKLLDFGSATSRTRPQPFSEPMSRGRQAFLAPELLSNGAADVRTDLYSFGICLYTLATATLPQGERFTPPSKINSAYSRRENALILKLLSADADDRPQDMGDVLTDLEKIMRKRKCSGYPVRMAMEE